MAIFNSYVKLPEGKLSRLSWGIKMTLSWDSKKTDQGHADWYFFADVKHEHPMNFTGKCRWDIEAIY